MGMQRGVTSISLAIALSLTGCGESTDSSPSGGAAGNQTDAPDLDNPSPDEPDTVDPPSSQPPAAPAPPAAASSGTSYTPAEFYEDYYTAVQVVDAFWHLHWSDYFTGAYSSPQMVTGSAYGLGMYDGTVDRALCGDHYLAPDNAEYCGPPASPGYDYVGFDVNFLWRARNNGDMFVYMIVAHEWGHAIQAQLDTSLASLAYELQADCLAGAALQGAVDDGSLALESGDIEEVSIGLTDIADSSPWGEPGDHGSPEERIANFNQGASQGPLGCIPR